MSTPNWHYGLLEHRLRRLAITVNTKTAPDRELLRSRATDLLQLLVGRPAQLRDDQWEAIEALVVDRRPALVVQRTGWGKSAVYFLATALLRAEGAGITVIVSPLLALMRNQIAAATRAGIRARTVNSTNVQEWSSIFEAIDRGEVDVLLVSPERLNNPEFRETVLARLIESCGLLVVDEAHCISDWGHDFRPDYRRIKTFIEALPADTPVLATTATAPSRVVDDVAEVLGLAGNAREVLVQRGTLDRESLRLSVVRLETQIQRLAWLADHLGELPGSGVIYALTVAATNEIADFLRGRGFAVRAYSGQSDEAERLAAEEALLNNEVKALVATSALGMGYDKPDLGFVIHFGAPSGPVAYYQQVGRAGRGVDRAEVILLPSSEDKEIWAYFSSVSFPKQENVTAVLSELDAVEGPLSTPALETRVNLSRTRLELLLKVLDADGAVRRVKGGWISTEVDWFYDVDRYSKVLETRKAEQQSMLEYIRTDRCRMRFLRELLDDPEAVDCGRCDNCTGEHRVTTTDVAALEAARLHIYRPGVTLNPRQQWPTGMKQLGFDVAGKIAAEERPEVGRAIARFTDLGYGRALRDLVAPDVADQEISSDLVDAAVRVLSAWKGEWQQRPEVVVSIGSISRPVLVKSFAEAIAGVGRRPYVGAVAHIGHSRTVDSNSAFRLRSVIDAFAIPPEVGEGIAGGRALLLVDDYWDTGWTMAVVARMLRHSGAGAVYPMVLGSAGRD
jgi:ATP-dependent DNA helicase RecQ